MPTTKYKLYNEDCRVVCDKVLRVNSVDSVICDPPYGLKFMGKDWDHGIPGVPFWSRIMRVCKPGAILLAFGGTRTYHRLACAIEDAGWEIRDCVLWLYGSGFPKSANISKNIDKAAGAEREVVGKSARHGGGSNDKYAQDSWTRENAATMGMTITAPATEAAKIWDGWGTSLKPAHENILVAMKPLDGTYAENAIKHGVAGINVDGCRIGTTTKRNKGGHQNRAGWVGGEVKYDTGEGVTAEVLNHGRWPANVIHDGSDEVLAGFPETKSGNLNAGHKRGSGVTSYDGGGGIIRKDYGGDSGSAARFFYCAKSSKKERGTDNYHPTVKPLALMEYLCKLTMTPTGGIVLDPFMGSGSTGVACANVGRRFIGIENDTEHGYFEIAEQRIRKAYSNKRSEKC